jgi:fructosamine-3-kinase
MPGSGLAEAIETALRAALGNDLTLAAFDAVEGAGTLKLDGRRGERFFVKLAPAAEADRLAAEADGLAALASNGAFRTPQVFAQGATDSSAFLALEFLALRPLSRDRGARAGEALAALHAPREASYGWPRDNYIGATEQTNTPHDFWPFFFASRRLHPQLELAASRGFCGKLQEHGERICEKSSAFFFEYRPSPALVHGDLWSGNIGELADGTPVIFDPAVYIGDRETDLAMTELFGGFPDSFYAAYRRALPLDVGYEQRKQLYNFYHVLNHLNLFGRSYLRQAEWMARKLFDELRH